MDTALALLIAKGATVLLGLTIFLRLLVVHYDEAAEEMAETVARAALERERQERAAAAGKPRVTLSPANDAAPEPAPHA